MSNCGDKFRLLRDGTSQEERLLAALQPAFVAVEERTVRDLTLFAQRLAEVIVHNSAEQEAPDQEALIESFEDWTPFFAHDPELSTFLSSNGRAEDFNQYLTSKGKYTEPQLALFLTFLQLWKIARDDMNNITARHLDYYYKEVLRLREKAAHADSTYILFELARHKDFYNLPKGTLLRAGKDRAGVEVLFATDRSLTLSHAQIAAYKSIWQAGSTRRPHVSAIANSADGAGAAIETEEQSWLPFGDSSRPEGETGFCISSPMLQLEGGQRDISILLELEGSIDPAITSAAANLRFDVYLSGEEAWLEPQLQAARSKGVIEVGKSDIKVFDSKNISPELERTILSYLNQVTKPEEIYSFVTDNPFSGYGNQIRDYGIGKTTAKKIIEERDKLQGKRFRSIAELDAVPGVGPDKIGDLGFSLLVHESQDSTIIDLDTNCILILRTLEASQDPVVNYNREVLVDPIGTGWPVAKVLLRSTNAAVAHPATFFGASRVKNIELEVSVTGLQQVLVQNESAVLDASKVLQPFGSRPRRKSHFYVGSREAFGKRLSALSVSWEWEGLGELEVEESGTTYRRMGNYYDVTGYTRSNSDFSISTSLLSGYQWQPLDEDLPLFTNALGGAVANSADLPDAGGRSLIRSLRGDLLRAITADEQLENFRAYGPDLERGFLRLSLTGEDFGHHDYQQVYTKQVMANTRQIVLGAEPTNPLPREPYTPAIKALQLNYTAHDRISLIADVPAEETGGRYFHLGPFGVGEVQASTVAGSVTAPPMLTDLQPTAQLCLGIAKLGQVRSLDLLIQVLEGSATPDSSIEGLQWSYLHQNQWKPLPQDAILSDGTNGLVNSGIIQIKLPSAFADTGTLLTDSLHWLRISISGEPAALPELVGMHTQAVQATFQDRGNDPLRLADALPAESIARLKVSDAAVAGISQPYASFGGKLSEEASNFYTRVSERLRHKRRAITLWDYEHLILHEFAGIYKVKCLNHTGFRRKADDKLIYSEMLPGHVTLVVLSNVRNKNAVDPLKPRSSQALLSAVNRFVEELNPAWVLESPTERNNNGSKLHVINPWFEEIRLDFEVRFHPGYDAIAYAAQLREEIRAFLSPWAYDNEADISFGGKIHKSRLLYFVEERPYVDFVTCFRMYHIYQDDALQRQEKEVDEARATRAASVLGSVSPVPEGTTNPLLKDHNITVMEEEECSCGDNAVDTRRASLPPDDYPIR